MKKQNSVDRFSKIRHEFPRRNWVFDRSTRQNLPAHGRRCLWARTTTTATKRLVIDPPQQRHSSSNGTSAAAVRTFLSIALAVSTAARPCTLRNAPTSPSVSSNRFNACVTSSSEDTRPDRTASAASRRGDAADAIDIEHDPFEALLVGSVSKLLLVACRLVEQLVCHVGFQLHGYVWNNSRWPTTILYILCNTPG